VNRLPGWRNELIHRAAGSTRQPTKPSSKPLANVTLAGERCPITNEEIHESAGD